MPTVGPGADLYPDSLPSVPGPRALDPATLALVGPTLPDAGREPLYLRRPDAAEPGRRKSVLVRGRPAVIMDEQTLSILPVRRDDLPGVMGLERAGFGASEQWSERSWLGEVLGDGRTTLLARRHVPVGSDRAADGG